MTRRTRAPIALVIAVLLIGALAALSGLRSPSTTTTVASVGDAEMPAEANSQAADAGLATATSTPTSTSTSTTATVPPPPRKPAVVATKPIGDYPAGTVMSGPVEMTGVVRDTDGVPIADACVTIRVGAAFDPILHMQTGADGAFAGAFDLDAIADGAYVAARDCSGAVPGFARQLVKLTVEPTKTYHVPITAPLGSALHGRLANASTGQTLADHCVGVAMGSIDTAWVRTDANGAWTVPDLPLGRYGFHVMAPDEPGCAFVNGANLWIERAMNPDTGEVRFDRSGDITKAGSVDHIDLYVSYRYA